MNKSSNALFGSPNFTIQVRRLEDGKYEASTPNQDLPPQRAVDEISAIRAMKRVCEDAMTQGNVQGQ